MSGMEQTVNTEETAGSAWLEAALLQPPALLAGIAAVIALAALVMTLVNLAGYRTPGAIDADAAEPDAGPRGVAVCIPARNEAANLRPCVEGAIAAAGADLPVEVLVYDDGSSDGTGELLAGLAAADPRVRAVETRPLPSGWNGKQHACDRMGRAASMPWLLFIDADVRLAPGALPASVAAAERLKVDLLSTFPKQRIGSLGEGLLVPLIFFLLFSYLPMGRMRRTTDPAASAGCGQFLLVRRAPYLACGGHGAFRDSMHDGIRLPRLLRRHGHRTDLFDGTDLAAVRMYRGLRESWTGFAKNAYEGLGSFGLLLLLTVLHAVGHLLPWAYLIAAATEPAWRNPWAIGLSLAAIALALVQRAMLAKRFRHPLWVVPLHPLSVLLMTLVQWDSLRLHLTGRRSWRGRVAGETA
jgi:glycosyltransferase involved in cell wall biosynthesis